MLHEGLNAGSQLPYIRECARRKWGIVVTNPRCVDGSERNEQHTDAGCVEHVLAVWEHYVARSRAGAFAIFAHRYGGFLAEEIVSLQFRLRFRSCIVSSFARVFGRFASANGTLVLAGLQPPHLQWHLL